MWKTLNIAVSMIQHAFKRFKVRKGLKWRKNIKNQLMGIVKAWQTRRSLNCLANEV